MILRSILLVGIGGAVGSMLRYMTGLLVNRYVGSGFPWATFVANMTGCFIIGLLFGLFERQTLPQTDLKLLFMTGFCGGFTTFSAFALENTTLLQGGQSGMAALYMAASTAAGILMVWCGIRVFLISSGSGT